MVGRLRFSQGIEIQLIAEADEINGRHGYICVYIFSDRPTNTHEGTAEYTAEKLLCCVYYIAQRKGVVVSTRNTKLTPTDHQLYSTRKNIRVSDVQHNGIYIKL